MRTKISNFKFQISNLLAPRLLNCYIVKLLYLLICLFAYLLILPPSAYAVVEDKDYPQPLFVPNQVIVKYKQGQSPVDLQTAVDREAARSQTIGGRFQNFVNNGLAIINFIFTGEIKESPADELNRIVQTKTNLEVIGEEQLFIPKVLGNDIPPELQGFYVYSTSGDIPIEQVMQQLANVPQVESVELNYIVKIQTIPNDILYPQMWNLPKIAMEQAWDLTTGSNDVTVAVVDTGVNTSHSDFAGRQFVPGRDYATCDRFANDGYCCDQHLNDPMFPECSDYVPKSCPKKPQGYCDDNAQDDVGHGTHVTGTIAASTNNDLGIAGVNWQVKILPVKTLNREGEGALSWVVNSIKYAADSGAQVINLSLGGCASIPNPNGSCPHNNNQISSTFKSAIDHAIGKGVTLAVAAGNSDDDARWYSPANYNNTPNRAGNILVVGATGPFDERSLYSNWGSIVNIAAPGGNVTLDRSGPNGTPDGRLTSYDCINAECIISTVLGDEYVAWEGTSMAAPHVAAAAALLLSIDSSLTPSQIEQILKNNGDTISTDKPIGKRLNGNQALLAVVGNTPPTPTVSITPPVATPTPTSSSLSAPTPTPTTLTPTTPTPTTLIGGPPTDIPTITLPDLIPTNTKAPTPPLPTLTPTVTPSHPCLDQAKKGDYNCDGQVDNSDFNSWLADYKLGKTTLPYFEYWRRAFYSQGQPPVPCSPPNQCLPLEQCPEDKRVKAVCEALVDVVCCLPISP